MGLYFMVLFYGVCIFIEFVFFGFWIYFDPIMALDLRYWLTLNLIN